MTIDTIDLKMHNYVINSRSLLILRVALSGIFLIAGTNHLIFPVKVAARLNNATMVDFALVLGSPEALIVLSGVFMIIGGLPVDRFSNTTGSYWPHTDTVAYHLYSTSGTMGYIRPPF